jgi:hypothetical protein|tara:strand:+ start:3521 stop:4345 length:825 start_codon:yes stop_codon:yes gene_type:complete
MNKISFVFSKAIFFTAITAVIYSTVFNTRVAADSEIPTYFIGYAYDIDSKKLVYSEHHQYVTPTLHQVEYKEPSGEIFATKTIDYSHSYFAPDFTQHNLRNGEKVAVYRRDSVNEKIKYAINYQENSKEDSESNTLKLRPRMVIDAGFDHFITKNWDALLAQESLTIDYLIPSALDHYELTVKENTCTNTTAKKNPESNDIESNDIERNDDESIHCFSISASSFFIGLFSSELGLTYAQNNTSKIIRLIEFRGRSNISDQDGNYQDVNINYTYF